MKDELHGEITSEIVSLRSKMYSTDVKDDHNEIKKLLVTRQKGDKNVW